MIISFAIESNNGLYNTWNRQCISNGEIIFLLSSVKSVISEIFMGVGVCVLYACMYCMLLWNEKAFVVNSVENVLLIAICLLTSLSCQFFCSSFVVAKDLSTSSFASYLKCQRCSFDVDYRPHARQHLCRSCARRHSVFTSQLSGGGSE